MRKIRFLAYGLESLNLPALSWEKLQGETFLSKSLK